MTEAAADELQSARGMISEVHDLIRPRGPNLLLERRVRWAKRQITQAQLRMSTAPRLLMLLDSEDPENLLYKEIDRVFEGNSTGRGWAGFLMGILTNFLFSLLFIVFGIIIAVSTMQGR